LTITKSGSQKPHLSNKKRDFLDNYPEVQIKYPGLIDDGQMVSYFLTNTVAGSHPTAYALTAIVYYVLRTPGVYSRLNRELDESQVNAFQLAGKLPRNCSIWKPSSKK
jgi:cytochrome P450